MITDENEPGTMTPIPTRRRLLGACAVGLSVVSAGCAGAMSSGDERTEFDRELDTDAGRVTVETDSGDARVRRTDADAIQVRGTKETRSAFTDLDDLTVETTRDSDHLRISADASGDSFLGLGGGSISLDVGAPEGIDVEAVSGETAMSPRPMSPAMRDSNPRTVRRRRATSTGSSRWRRRAGPSVREASPVSMGPRRPTATSPSRVPRSTATCRYRR